MFYDDVPDNIPWQLLIRARFVHEIDALVASVVTQRVSQVATVEVARAVATAAQHAGASREVREASAEQRVAALEAVLDWDDDLCPRRPHPWPWPGPRRVFDDLSDPVAGMVIAQALDLVKVAGSDHLQSTLGATLAKSTAGVR
jgi:hypothetical protein